MKLTDANLKIILDSRGNETLEAELRSSNISAFASIPAGKSTGIYEAFVLAPKKAIKKFKTIKSRYVINREFNSQEEFDNFLISLDGTLNKQNFGANCILALSLAWARLKAKSEGKELFQYIADLCANNQHKPAFNSSKSSLKPIFNLINGGAHAVHPKSKLDFQEFQIIPTIKDFGVAFNIGKDFYSKLKIVLKNKFSKEDIFLGDEAGFSAPFKSNEEAIEILANLISKYNYPLMIGLDVAASQFYKKKEEGGNKKEYYLVGGKKYSAEELKNLYLKFAETYNILLIEDSFYEESFKDFTKLTLKLAQNRREILIITDDLTATNYKRLKKAIEKKSGNTILIKLNQIGTLTETLKVVELAYANNWQIIVSHRSGETMDNFIADLAIGTNAWGIKAGAPAMPERLVKYKRVLEIEKK